MSHLHGSGEYPYMTNWLCHHTDSSRQSPGLWWDQIAVVIPDLSNFVAQVPVILGTPMIGHIMNVIKESKLHMLSTPWINAWVAYLLAVWWVTATAADYKAATKVLDPTEYDEVITTQEVEMIDTFSFKIIHVRTKTAFTKARLNVMTQALCAEEGPLPQGLMVQSAYTEMHKGSKSVAVMVRNGVAYPLTLKKKIPVTKVVAANWVAEVQMQPGMVDTLDEVQGIQILRLTMKQRQKRLFEKLDLRSLGSWPLELADSAHSLLAEYHNIFFLRTLQAWLYPFDQTCDESHWWCPIQRMIQPDPPAISRRGPHTPARDVVFTPARVCGVMPWCSFARKMAVYIFA